MANTNAIYEEYLRNKAEYDEILADYDICHVGSPSVFLAFVEARAVYDFSNNTINTSGYPIDTIEHKAYLNKIGELIEKSRK